MGSFPETYNHLRGRECMKFCILRTYITVCNRDMFVFKSNFVYTYRANHGLAEFFSSAYNYFPYLRAP